MSMLFTKTYIDRPIENMKTKEDLRKDLDAVLNSIEDVIRDLGAEGRRVEELTQDVVTDIFYPAIKESFEDSIHYLIGGCIAYKDRYHQYKKGCGEYVYSDDEENEDEEEDS